MTASLAPEALRAGVPINRGAAAVAAVTAAAVALLVSCEVFAMVVPLTWTLCAALHLGVDASGGEALVIGAVAAVAAAVVMFRCAYGAEKRLAAGLDLRSGLPERVE